MPRARSLLLVAALGLAIRDAGARAPAGAIDFTVADVIALEPGAWLLAIQDLDGDRRLDLAVLDADDRRVRVYERRGGELALVWERAFPSPFASHVREVADVDGDGYPELLLRDGRAGDVVVVEARGDDAYADRRLAIGPIREQVCVADTDADGRPEIVAGQTSFPSRIHRFEAIDDDRYEPLPVLEGPGGEVYLACPGPGLRAPDLRLAWADTHFWRAVERWRWIDGDGATGSASRVGALPVALADTDGDGRAEAVATGRAGELVLVERGNDGALVEVLRDPAARCAEPAPYGGSARTELVCRDADGDELAIRAREGGALVTVWRSRGVGWWAPGRIVRAYTVDDQNGDGRPELAVVRAGAAQLVHLLVSRAR